MFFNSKLNFQIQSPICYPKYCFLLLYSIYWVGFSLIGKLSSSDIPITIPLSFPVLTVPFLSLTLLSLRI